MRATRLLDLLLHLQVRGQVPGSELARRLEVSERTVQRDVEALAAMGVPVHAVRGPGGGYRLDGGYRTRLTGVGADEAGALAFLGLDAAAVALGLAEQLEIARMKVWAGLSSEARARAQGRAQRFHLDPVRWYGTSEPVPHLHDLAAAVWGDRRVRLEYVRRGDGEPVRRVVDPLGLVLAAGDWYLVGLRDGERRTYRVGRVRDVEVLEEAVRRPPDFDLAQAWSRARDELERSHRLIEVTVRVSPAALPRLRRVVAVAGQDRVPVDGTSELVLTVPFEGERWALSTLLGLGADVEVLAPASLRERLAHEVHALAARYPPLQTSGQRAGADGGLAGRGGVERHR